MRAQLGNDLSDILLPRVRQRLDLKDEVMSIQVARCPCVELGVGRKEKGLQDPHLPSLSPTSYLGINCPKHRPSSEKHSYRR